MDVQYTLKSLILLGKNGICLLGRAWEGHGLVGARLVHDN